MWLEVSEQEERLGDETVGQIMQTFADDDKGVLLLI